MAGSQKKSAVCRDGVRRGILQTPFEPTRDDRARVLKMKGLQMTNVQIMAVIINPNTGRPIDVVTFKGHFATELERGEGVVREMVASALLARAVDPSNPSGVTAAIWLEKSRFGITDRDQERDADALTSFREIFRLISTSVPATAADGEEADARYKKLEETPVESALMSDEDVKIQGQIRKELREKATQLNGSNGR